MPASLLARMLGDSLAVLLARPTRDARACSLICSHPCVIAPEGDGVCSARDRARSQARCRQLGPRLDAGRGRPTTRAPRIHRKQTRQYRIRFPSAAIMHHGQRRCTQCVNASTDGATVACLPWGSLPMRTLDNPRMPPQTETTCIACERRRRPGLQIGSQYSSGCECSADEGAETEPYRPGSYSLVQPCCPVRG